MSGIDTELPDPFNENWDSELGLWIGDAKYNRTGHGIRNNAKMLVEAGILGLLERVPAETVLGKLRQAQETNGQLRGNFWWAWEDGKVTDRNSGFFTTIQLLALKHEFEDQLSSAGRADLEQMLGEAEHWFAHKVLPVEEKKLRYPNAYLGDAVCLWLIREHAGTLDSAYGRTFRKILAWYRDNHWGWGEHLSDIYAKVCQRELTALLMWSKELDDDARCLATELMRELMTIDTVFDGGPRVPTLRCYSMEKSPCTPEAWAKSFQPYRNRMRSQAPVAGFGFAYLAARRGLFRDLPLPAFDSPERDVACYGNTKAASWVTARYRYGTMSVYPLFEDTNANAGWGLHWQSMPVAFWHAAGDWGYLQWLSEERGVVHALPGLSRADTQKNQLCRLSDIDTEATHGLTYGTRHDNALLIYRELPRIAASWPWAADRFRLVHPTANADAEDLGDWQRLVLDFGTEKLTVACHPLQKGTVCTLSRQTVSNLSEQDSGDRENRELHFSAHHKLSDQRPEKLRFLWFIRMGETASTPPQVKDMGNTLTAVFSRSDTIRFAEQTGWER